MPAGPASRHRPPEPWSGAADPAVPGRRPAPAGLRRRRSVNAALSPRPMQPRPTSRRSASTTPCCCSTSSSSQPSRTPDAATLRGLERPLRRALADPAELLEPDQGPLAPDRRTAGAPVRAAACTSRSAGWTCRTTASPSASSAAHPPPAGDSPTRRPPSATRRTPRTTTSASSSASMLTYYRRHPQRASRAASWTCSAKVLTPPAEPAPKPCDGHDVQARAAPRRCRGAAPPRRPTTPRRCGAAPRPASRR
ncbi:MAG: hypothetical protein MZW92_47095 [Comamonadaceae bacterium]|nr:hypothetical protein [Comamonadaceae bacterium]